MNTKIKNRKPIGRTHGRSVDLTNVESSVNVIKIVNEDKQDDVIYKLASGREITFYRQHVPADKVTTLTHVHPMNKRNSEDLTRPSLALLINSIGRQQYQPIIAQELNGQFATMDGSRRRQAAIYAGVGLDLLYCKEELTNAEVKSLSKELQTAKEHSVRENGKVFAQLMKDNPNLTQKDAAEQEGFTQSYVSKAIQAWEIPQSLINLYQFPSDITLNEFGKLAKVTKQLKKSGADINELVDSIEIEQGQFNDDVTQMLIETVGLKKPTTSVKPIKIVELNAKKWAKVLRNKEKTTITLSRLTEDEYVQIEQFIKDVMMK
ncbi:ParB/RepB/Spo0J family partition protein [Pseudomonadota bacterium]